jgi:PAS domain S-box-containing protein
VQNFAVLDSLADAIVVGDLEDRIVHVNPAAERLLGWTCHEARGESLKILMPARMHDAHDRGFRRFVATGEGRILGRAVRVPALRKDGTEIEIELALSTFRFGDGPTSIIATIRDLADRVELERHLQISKYLKAANKAAASLTETLDVAHVVRTAAASLVDGFDAALGRVWLLDASRGSLVLHASAGLSAQIEESSRAVIDLASYPYKVASVARTRMPLVTNDLSSDTEFDPEWVQREGIRAAAVLPLAAGGELRGVLAAFFRFPLADEVQEALLTYSTLVASALNDSLLHDAERAARERAQEASRLKDEFLATVSHELRTPLSAILGWASMLASDRTRDVISVQRAIEVIERNARSQLRIVEDILDVSRIVRGTLRIETETVDLQAIVKDVLDSIEPAAAARQLTIAFHPFAGDCKLMADHERLRQVIWNLVSNATKFTPEGGEIDVSIDQRMGSFVVAVRDTGQGIAPEFLPYVFDRFRQADASITRTRGGLGLGLAIVKHLVEMHGGSVAVTSEGIGKGSTFTVTLPVKPFTARIDVTPARPEQPASNGSLEGLRLLVVEDDPDSRELIELVLTSEGAHVDGASSADEALKAFDRSQPDVVVSDIGMPGHDGYWLVRQLRERFPAVRVLALTAYTRREDARRAEEAGFDAHLGKPVDPARLVETIAAMR